MPFIVEVPKMVKIESKLVWTIKCILMIIFVFIAIAQALVLNSWAVFEAPRSIHLTMYPVSFTDTTANYTDAQCAELAAGMHGFNDCLEPPYWDASTYQWLQMPRDNDSCRKLAMLFGAIQMQNQPTERVYCVPAQAAGGTRATIKGNEFEWTSVQITKPFTCAPGSAGAQCVFNWDLPNNSATIYTGLEEQTMITALKTFSSKEQVTMPELDLVDTTGVTTRTVPAGSPFMFSVAEMLMLTGAELDTVVQVSQWSDQSINPTNR